MQSFYGGRQGISFILKRQFASVEEMEAFFAKGAETTSEVGYGEYVVINTKIRTKKINGDVYRRGFEGAEGPICNILGPRGFSPRLKVESQDEVMDYINENSERYYAYTQETGEDIEDLRGWGTWSATEGTQTTVYQLMADPTCIISSETYNKLNEYGKDDYIESDEISYIKVIYYYLHKNGVNLITRLDWKDLAAVDRARYELCYISKTNSDFRITESTFATLTAEEQKNYKIYCKSDSTKIITQDDYDALPDYDPILITSNDDKGDYDECYVEKYRSSDFKCYEEYKSLTKEEQEQYIPFVVIYYNKYDKADIKTIYQYDNLSQTGKVDYVAYTYNKSRGLYKPNHDGDSEIYYAYASVLDADGNSTTALVGFSFPYYEEAFFYDVISPYKDGKRYATNEAIPAVIHDNKDYNYYKEWTLTIPSGVQGDSVTSIFVAPDYARMGTVAYNKPSYTLARNMELTSFTLNDGGKAVIGKGTIDGDEYTVKLSTLNTQDQDFFYWAEITDYSEYEAGEKYYKKIGKYQTIKRVTIAETNGTGYHLHDLLILYSDESMKGNITYNGVYGWINAGNTRGKVQGLRVFAVYDSIAAFTAESGTHTPEELALIHGLNADDAANCAGWGVIAVNPSDGSGDVNSSVYFYDYGQKKWKKAASTIGIGLADPEEVLYISDGTDETTADSTLAENGYWMITSQINRAY